MWWKYVYLSIYHLYQQIITYPSLIYTASPLSLFWNKVYFIRESATSKPQIQTRLDTLNFFVDVKIDFG